MLKIDGVGERLREERERLGMNQTDFGAKMGVSRGTQKAYELGSGSPDLRYLAALENAGVDVSYVLAGLRASPNVEEQIQAEISLINNFRAISEFDKEAVQRVVGAMAELVEKKK